MKIDLSAIDPEQFNVNPCVIGGDKCFFITPPHIGTKWNKSNLIFRSSIWNEQGEPVSLSFKKFFNWGEQPELAYTPFSLAANGGVKMIEKIDGSTLIVSKYKGELIVRTRGSLRPENMVKAGHEIAILKGKYPKVFSELDVITGEPYTEPGLSWPYSFLYEWASPGNQIVVKHSEPELYLLAIVNHADYRYLEQGFVDRVADGFGVKRPRKFTFNSFDEVFAAIHALDYSATTKKKSPQEVLTETRAKEQSELTRNFEGFCVYCNRDQDIRKVKSAWYLAMHKMKSELSSIEKVVDLWATLDYPPFPEFIKYINDNFDWEIANACLPYSSRICDAKKQVDDIVEGMKRFVDPLREKSRRDAALSIQAAYGTTNRGGYCFTMLDNKPLTRDNYKKLLYQCLK